ncbi:trans-sulfuration enzyme family protein [Mesobacillus zeae]|uniref:homocysteine desulfhydrase n=1 Tax=Mesobacillus zeae TaxID=1917180 RepID=A0A398AXT2_9BACI|nr:aminotransferase class I/II-fold pyridoxal phosphate-dependent enzyme [Mesobacillus zeae]RID82452.1 aminotransferase class I/II-fold pyridoxal phosphate-dependent enzyme [Mesobacillus zeae]
MAERFETLVLHGTCKVKGNIKSKAAPIYQTSAFTFGDLDELEGFYHGEGNYLYSRVGNPNTDELGAAVAALEGAPAGVAASSGLSAILAGILAVAKNGDHIVAAEDVYGGSYHMLKAELSGLGIETTFVSFKDLKSIEGAITEKTKLLYTESITNPFLRVENVEEVVKIAKKHGIYTLVDNTFATPYHCRLFLEGVDLVAHSATKYIGGHSDVTAGVIVGGAELIDKARARIVNLGLNLSPFEAWLTCRGLKTLALRMKAQSENAKELAESLRDNRNVRKVYYPFERGEKGYGAVVTVELGQEVDIHRFFRSLGWVKIVPTLAGVVTSVSHPLKTSHRALPPEAQEELGITMSVVRISVGIENSGDIIGQFDKAIEMALI